MATPTQKFPTIRILDATLEQLEGLPMVGPVRSQKLLDLIEAKRPFIYFDDLARVSDVSVKTWKAWEKDGTIMMPLQDLWDFRQHASEDMKRLEKQFASMQERYDQISQLGDVDQQVANATATIRNDFESRLSHARADFEDKLAEADQAFQKQLADARDGFDQRLANIEQQHLAELADADARLIRELATLQADHECKVTGLQDGYEKKLEEMRTTYDTEIQEQQASFTKSRQALIDEINRLEDNVRALETNAANDNRALSDELTLLRGRVDALLREKSDLNAVLADERRINAANDSKALADEVLLRNRVDALFHEKSDLDTALAEEKRIVASLRGDSEKLRQHHALEIRRVQTDMASQLKDEMDQSAKLQQEVMELRARIAVLEQSHQDTSLGKSSQAATSEVLNKVSPVLPADGVYHAAHSVGGQVDPRSCVAPGSGLDTGLSGGVHSHSFGLSGVATAHSADNKGGRDALSSGGSAVRPPDYDGLHHLGAGQRVPAGSWNGRSSVDGDPLRGFQGSPGRGCGRRTLADEVYDSYGPSGPYHSMGTTPSSRYYGGGSSQRQDFMGPAHNSPSRHGHTSRRDQQKGPKNISSQLGFDSRYRRSGGSVRDSPLRHDLSSKHRQYVSRSPSRSKSYGGRSFSDQGYDKPRRSKDQWDPSESSSDSDSDSSVTSVSSEERPKHGHSRPKGPPPPKMEIFTGTVGAWRPFKLQFKQAARQYKWSYSEKKSRLMECLRGKAIEFVYSQSSDIRKDYKRLVKCLSNRFGDNDSLSIKRRQLLVSRQGEDESVEDWADRVSRLVHDAYKHAGEKALQDMAVESFFRGCRERHAVVAAADKCPKTFHQR